MNLQRLSARRRPGPPGVNRSIAGRLASIGLVGALVVACAPSVAPPPELPEPAIPLRTESLRGSVLTAARITDYELEARLDVEEHTVDGLARVTWRNTTTRTVNTLPFHLYMNGFRSEETAWMKTSHGRHRRSAIGEEGTWGYIDIKSVRLLGAGPTTGASGSEEAEFESGPVLVEDPVERPGTVAAETVVEDLAWSEDAEPSTMTVTLPRPVGPGESVTVELDFLTRLPKVVARTGYSEDFHAVAQWYPKLGVLEEETGWQAHTFTYHDEFYADFGHYDVSLDVPEAMVVGATGIRTDEEAVGEGRKRLSYRAEMVHDFAWFADPDFVEHHAEHRGVRIRQLIQPEHFADAEAHLAAQVAAIDTYDARFGPYPWSTLTIVHPPKGAEGAGGMEYPTLFTTDDRSPIPQWIRNTVMDERISGLDTTVHEYGHQYFQGLFAVREHAEPWLDEGMNTFSNFLALQDRLGEEAWLVRLLNFKMYARDFMRLRLGRKGFWEPIDRPASAFGNVLGNYGSTIYGKTAGLMATLRNLVGAEKFDRALEVFSEQARFRHPRGEELEMVLVDELGSQLNLAEVGQPPAILDVQEYLDQSLRTQGQIDFEVLVVDNRRRMGKAGWRRDASGQLEGGEPPADLGEDVDDLPDDKIEGVVAIRRAGDFIVPVELRVEMASGEVETRVWDGREPTTVFTFPGQRVDRAMLDPDHKLLLEWQRLDNTALAEDLRWQGDGASGPFGHLIEGLTLALLGSLGP